LRVELTKQECLWLATLAKTAKEEADSLFEANPHGLFALRRDNMADLEKKLNAAVQREIEKDSKDMRKVKESKQIRFIDPQYKELFRIPDGGSIVVTRPEGEMYPGVQEQWVGVCEYLDDTHVAINGECYHICQFAEIQQNIGSTYFPEPESEMVDGYRITHRTFVRDLIFKLGHNPDAAEPYATWRCNKDDPKNNYWGHYWSDKRTAHTDFSRRADAARTDTPYDHTLLMRQKPSLKDTIRQNTERSKAEFGDQSSTPQKSKEQEI